MSRAIAAIFPPVTATSATALKDWEGSMTRAPFSSNSVLFRSRGLNDASGHVPVKNGTVPAPMMCTISRRVMIMGHPVQYWRTLNFSG